MGVTKNTEKKNYRQIIFVKKNVDREANEFGHNNLKLILDNLIKIRKITPSDFNFHSRKHFSFYYISLVLACFVLREIICASQCIKINKKKKIKKKKRLEITPLERNDII